ncbi:unnamed protein product [Vitrella brassicaformis CCMP3155]|uniref:Uncharacterized protein n=1 Tax=Vitrella brassicaformis (strain CCMP3155) TaxID=1169540 RepID=A0A0G4H052_VITBC|nr:unnamed protein product [Vitrella brassicaformis CCMP3155]|eukprot:CEM36650.1 unnamed protein product [Vitrella brassicaformis CCMP3155]
MYYSPPSPTSSAASSVCETEYYYAAPAHGRTYGGMSEADLLELIKALGWTDPLQQQELVKAMLTFPGPLTPVTGSSRRPEKRMAETVKPAAIPSLHTSSKLTNNVPEVDKKAGAFSWLNPLSWFASCLSPRYS